MTKINLKLKASEPPVSWIFRQMGRLNQNNFFTQFRSSNSKLATRLWQKNKKFW